jgi:hypothetical protein
MTLRNPDSQTWSFWSSSPETYFPATLCYGTGYWSIQPTWTTGTGILSYPTLSARVPTTGAAFYLTLFLAAVPSTAYLTLSAAVPPIWATRTDKLALFGLAALTKEGLLPFSLFPYLILFPAAVSSTAYLILFPAAVSSTAYLTLFPAAVSSTAYLILFPNAVPSTAYLTLSAAVPPIWATRTDKLALFGLAALTEGRLALLTLPLPYTGTLPGCSTINCLPDILGCSTTDLSSPHRQTRSFWSCSPDKRGSCPSHSSLTWHSSRLQYHNCLPVPVPDTLPGCSTINCLPDTLCCSTTDWSSPHRQTRSFWSCSPDRRGSCPSHSSLH